MVTQNVRQACAGDDAPELDQLAPDAQRAGEDELGHVEAEQITCHSAITAHQQDPGRPALELPVVLHGAAFSRGLPANGADVPAQFMHDVA